MAEGDNIVNDDQKNFEQVQQLIRDQVRQHATEFFTEQQQQQQHVSNPQQLTQQQLAQQQLREVIDPIYGADISGIRLDAADAKDESTFYRRNPDAADYEDAIEKQFNELKKNGRPTTRQDIYDWMNGREQRVEPEKFTQRQEAKRKQQLDRAEAAADVGAFGGKIKQDDYVKFTNFESKTLEEQEQALDGMTF